ncbi:tetratricopeptide repeat protein [Glaciecola sp. 1036]|uniref:tetratricopeptide repeat protein n=1 Tax=Alteromonadaceae TaxID=72275 RepID=UPI003D06AE57
MSRFIDELKRREMIKPLLAYIGIAWLVLQIISVLSGTFALHPLVGSGVFLLFVFGFPILCFLTWHFDISLSGITRTPSSGNLKHQPFGIFNWLGLVVIVIISGLVSIRLFYTIYDSHLSQKTQVIQTNSIKSIAVLPFVDESPNKDQNYIALGLSEEITSLLGGLDSFQVSASRSSQILSEKGLSNTEIGQRLNVDAILTGSVINDGQRINIRTELIEITTGRVLWNESFQRDMTDIFELESEISRTVVNLLQDSYTQSGELSALSKTKSVDALVLYLKGREAYRKQTTESMQQARSLFEQAIAIDPEYAQAYVALADTLTLLAEGGGRFGIIDTNIAANLAEDNLNKAMVREPKIADIYAVMGQINKLRNQYEESLKNYDKATEINPSLAIAYMWKANALYALQRFDEAIETLKESIKLDPLFSGSAYNLGMMLSWQARFDEAEIVFEQLKIDHPDSTYAYQGLADMYFSQGNFVASIAQAKKAIALSPDNPELIYKLEGPLIQLGLVDILQNMDYDPSLEATILIFEGKFKLLFEKMDFDTAANPDDYWTAFEAGWYHAMFGDQARALELIINNSQQLDDADKYYMPYCSPAIEIAWSYQQQKKLDDAEQILTTCASLLKQQEASSIAQSELFYLGARLNALNGNNENAMTYLKQAVDFGWREWWTKHDPLLTSLHNENDYIEVIDFIEKDLQNQANEARKIFQE